MVSKIRAITRLLRINQYYKNVILFLGVFFGGKMFDLTVYPSLILAFILVCLASSLNYIQNDIADIEKDKIHPEKSKTRPLASGDLSKTFAWCLFGVISAIELTYIIWMRNVFSLLLIVIYLNGLSYNLFFKNHAFADIIALSTIYIWRSLAGCVIINIRISPWLIIMIFLLAMFLAVCKRIADLDLIGEADASKHKKIYDQYSAKLLDQILNMIATSLFIIYTLYCVLGPQEAGSIIPLENQGYLVYSAPVALYLIIRYLYLLHARPEVARKTEKAIHDKGLLLGGILLVIIVFVVIYEERGFQLMSINFDLF
jgi:4-hydroxybenzoate polyprenyltransferase